MQKTGADKDIRVVDPAREILSDYSDREGETRFVFPALDRYVQSPEYDTATDAGIRRAQKAYGSRVWKDLQIIRERAEIEPPLSMHVARHTFAVQAIEAGWTIRDLQRAFAHSTLTTTEQYIRTLRDDELDDQHEDLF
jgi:integrase